MNAPRHKPSDARPWRPTVTNGWARAVCAAALAWLAAAMPTVAAETAKDRPNIIFILSDDYGIGGAGCYGSTQYKTPNLDRLAAGGVRFENCYSAPLCGPSRASILTGQYSHNHGVIGNEPPDQGFVAFRRHDHHRPLRRMVTR